MVDCAWVTQALKEEDVEKAIVLGKSLRRVLTRKRLAVVVHPSMSLALRDALEATFDFVLSLDEGKCGGLQELNMDANALAITFSMSFTFFDKCIYLQPNSLILKNCDELFDDEVTRKSAEEYHINRKHMEEGHALYFQPGREAFKSLKTFLMWSKQNDNGHYDTNTVLMKWIENQPNDFVDFFGKPHMEAIRITGGSVLKNDEKLAIGHLVDLPSKMNITNAKKIGLNSCDGLLEKFIYDLWLEIFGNVKLPTPVNKETTEDNSHHINEPENENHSFNKNREPIAVVGMSCRFPASNNISEFWNILIEGQDAIRTPPDHRWTKEHSVFNNPEARKTQAGFLKVPIDEFDAKFFGISPKEMIFIDPQHRILHELVWEALEDAAINPLELNGTDGGVFMGSWRNDYYDILKNSSSIEFYRGYMGNSIGAGAARISHLLGLTGPCVATESGCSAAMVAVHTACRSLQNGESSMALACGVNLLLHPFTTDIMPMVTAPDGHCKSFAANADGFGRAEGCGVLVLKRLSDAVKDGDNIWGVIRGTAIAQEGVSKSMGTPTVQCEAKAMQSALRDAKVHPSQVSYVESHGTGTIVGDPMEVAAIGKVYSEGRKEPLIIGSVKTNVGHTESCSGITALMKVLLSMKHEIIPRHRNFNELNPDINLDIIPARLPLEPVAWPKNPKRPRIAGVSSFGITGTDGHMIVEEPSDFSSQRIVLKGFERPLHLMTISARTEEALDVLLDRYKVSLASNEIINFPNFAYTANVGRAIFNWRAAVIAKDEQDAVTVLGSNRLLKDEIGEEIAGKLCFLFTGQGSQYPGMARELYTTNPVFQMHFDNCEKILKETYGISIAKAFWETKAKKLASRTLYSQTGIFVVEYCLMKLWESWGVKPDVVLGHSLGEFCAAVCAGILRFEEALTLVAERSRLIDELPEGKMLVVKADKASVDSLQKSFMESKRDAGPCLDYAAINSPDQTVLAGDSEKIVEFSEWMKERNVKSVVLQSSHAFHSKHMDPIIQKYKTILESIFKTKKSIEPSCTFVSGMLGKVMDISGCPVDWPEYWVQHTREKVNFLSSSKSVYDECNCRTFLEIGPHPVLIAFTMMNNDGKQMTCLPSLRRNETDWRTMLTSVAKLFVTGAAEINWKGFDQFYDRKKVGQMLPTYPFQGTKYWPNILSSTGVQIHPLLGSSLPNPTNAKLFQNSLSLQDVEYLNDHVIGTMVVFPGAGYMETLLMAGHVTMEGTTTEFRVPRRPIQLENFRIEAPLGLEDGTSCNYQTVVEYCSGESDSAGDLEIKFFHKLNESEDSSSKWTRHASTSFSLYNPGNETNEQLDLGDKEFYMGAISRLTTSGKEENSTKEFYDKVEDVGLKFGPAFRTLSKVWRGTDGKQEFLAQVIIPSDAENYLVHPTIIDAMIQATVFHGVGSKKIEKKLRVPIACERFIWFKPLKVTTEESPEQNTCFVYSSGKSGTVVLLNKNGDLVAALVKVEAIETNAKSIHALLETQVKSTPDMYKTNWKSTLGPSQRRLDTSLVIDIVEELENEETDQSDYSEITVQARRDIEKLVYYYVFTAFHNLGWRPKINDVIILEEFVDQLGIKQQHRQLVRQFLVILEEEGVLEAQNENQWSVNMVQEGIEKLPKICEEMAEKLRHVQVYKDPVLLLQSCGEKLDKVLSGTESALRILFPDDESKPSASKFYDSSFKAAKGILYRAWCKVWDNCKQVYEKANLQLPVIRFLEVGAGTGSVTETAIDSLEAYGIPYEYHYTDISAAFFPAAEKRFEKSKRNFKFRKLNLEQDPSSQGFAPKYYDYVFGCQVIHATRDIKETFLNMRQLVKENGCLLIGESLGCRRLIDCIFGLLDGFWRFTDFELRPHHAMMSVEKWADVGKLTGFSRVSFVHDDELSMIAFRADSSKICNYDKMSKSLNSSMQQIHLHSTVAWLIFYGEEEEEYVLRLKKRFDYIGRKVVILVKHSANQACQGVDNCRLKYEINAARKEDIESLFHILKQSTMKDHQNGFSSLEGILVTWGLCGSDCDQTKIALPFLNLMQNVLKLDKKALPQVVVLTAGQYPIGDILCENPSSSTLLGMSRCVANEHSELKIRGFDIAPHEISSTVNDVFQEIFTGFNDEVAHFCAFRNGERLIPKLFPEKIQSKSLPLPPGADRFQLIHPKSKSIQDLEFGDLEFFTLKPNEIEVKVKCSALNFKDILNILKPTEEFKDSDGVGFDFAGVVIRVGEAVTLRKIGDPVFGINIMGNALPSHIKLPEEAIVSVPDSCTFTEAACFPAVFSTAYYCLVNIAHAKKGDNLLIHTASGGVGLLTIQLAKYLGLNIFCTAGNRRKRAYLRSLGVQNVFHSRNTDYGNEIMKVTNGRGIDIVLNSLTGPGFKEATLGACAKGARFVEMSKLNIWTKEEVAEQRPDVEYTIVDLTKLDEDTSRKLLSESQKLLEQGVIQPIPYTRFDAQNIREALTYLQKAQHIGKVVVTMPERKPGQIERTQMFTPLFNERSTYLITGGLGGVGMEVCKYLIEQGARNVVLVGRKPPTDKTRDIIENLKRENNCNVVVYQADVGDWAQCQDMFRMMKDPSNKLPPLRGIMHCAGTLADALIENVKWENFVTTYQAKIQGTWNLHELTKDTILEHFVLFSSVTAPFGSPGQSTHVSACLFEDTMTHYRLSHGLPGTSVAWGQFGQIGIAAEADVIIIRPFSPQQGINALDVIIRQNQNFLAVASFEKALAGVLKYLPYTKRVVDEQVLRVADAHHNTKKTLSLTSEQFWEEYGDCKDEREKKVEVIKGYTKILLGHVLRLDSDEPIDGNMDLQDLGVDSLMMLELKNHLQEILGDRVQVTQAALKDCTTVNLLSERLVQIIEEEGEFGSVEPPTLEQIHEMVLEDTKLPEHIRPQVPGSEKKPSEIKVILMTGATGSLGSHMLREILEECPQLERVYALVRTRGGESAEERLTTVLERKCIMGYMKNFDKVQCIPGNFIEEKFGLSNSDYSSLANEVDAVLHCGAKVSHVEFYRTVTNGRSDARSVNVGGFLRVLEFAGTSRTKHVFNASTLFISHEINEEDDTLYEGWPKDLDIPFNRGYLVSKYVCDFLLKEAVERGIPAKSFKLAEMRGSKITGGSNLENSHMMKSFLFFMKEGIMPETPFPSNFMPIDLASRLCVRIMFNNDAPNDSYNISHPEPQLAQEYFPKLAEELGYHVELVSFEEYRERALGKTGIDEGTNKVKEALIAEFQDLYKDESGFLSVFTSSSKSIAKFWENSDKFVRSKLLSKFVPELYNYVESSYEIHRRDLLAAKREGILEKLGL